MRRVQLSIGRRGVRFSLLLVALLTSSTVSLAPAIASAGDAEGSTVSIPYPPLPVADSRYAHDRALPFTTPPSIARGALPGDPRELVELWTAQRKAMALNADPDLVSGLVAAPDAMSQVRDYGVVLAADEVPLFNRGRAAEEIKSAIFHEHGRKDWFASIRIEWAGDSILSPPTIVLAVTARGLPSAQDAARAYERRGIPIVLRSAQFSRSELLDFIQMLERPDSTPLVSSNATVLPQVATRELARELQSTNGGVLGFSINVVKPDSIRAWVRSNDPSRPAVHRPGLPAVVYEPVREAKASSLNPCEGRGCSPIHAGVQVAYPPNYCSLGMPLLNASTNNRLWSTAGHCLGSSFSSYFASGNTAYPSYFERNRLAVMGAGGPSGYYHNSTIDARTVRPRHGAGW